MRSLNRTFVSSRFAAGLCAATLLFAAPIAARSADPAKSSEAITPAAVALGHPVDFEKDVYPILEANCLACHNAGIAESKLNVETADAIRNGGKRGASIVAKKPEQSLLFQFASRAKQPAMPPLPNKVEANRLTPQQLGVLKQWILEGARGGAGSGGDAVAWRPMPPEMKSIFAVAISPDGGRFVAAGRANQVVVYDVPARREVQRLVDPALSGIQLDGRPMYPGGAADRDVIHALAFSPDGTILAAAGYRAVKLWKRPHAIEKQSATLSAAPTALAVSRAGDLVAVALADHSIVVRHAEGTELRKLAGPAAAIGALEFSPDGKMVYAGSLDRALRSWTISDGVVRGTVATDSPIVSLTISKDGSQLIAGCADGTIGIWSAVLPKSDGTTKTAPAPKPLRSWKAHAKPITALALVLPSGDKIVSASEDGSVRVWQLSSAKQLARFDQGGAVSAVAVRPDGQTVASTGTNRVTRLWPITGGAPVAEFTGSVSADRLVARLTDEKAIAAQHVATVTARLTALGQDVKEREEAVKKGAESQSAAEKALAGLVTKEKAASAAVAVAKKKLSADPRSDGPQRKFKEAESALEVAARVRQVAADNSSAAARAHDAAKKALVAAEQKLNEQRKLKQDLETALGVAAKKLAEATANQRKRQSIVRSLAFSADGSVLAVAGDDSEIDLRDAHTGRPLDALSGHASGIAKVAFGKGATLISAEGDKRLVAWETNPAWTFLGQIGPKPDAPLDLSASALVGRVLGLAFNHDGTLLATGGGEPSRSGELKTWKIPSLTLDRDFKDAHSDTVFGVDFSRDGRYLASCAADKFVKVFETRTGKLTHSFEGHTHQVLGISWKADGSLLASAGADNQIKIWNFETGEQQRSIASHSKQVTSVQFLGTGANIVTAGGDKTVRLHQAIDGDNYRTLDGASDYLYSAAATADESLVAAGGEDGVLRIWNGATGKSLVTFPPPKPGSESSQASAAKR